LTRRPTRISPGTAVIREFNQLCVHAFDDAGDAVTYHRSHKGERPSGPQDVLVEEIQQTYRGKVVAARDLDIF
jgi:hypothetical protein